MDAARGLFVATGLAPEPPTYELFWLHVSGRDAALSRAIEAALADGRLDAGAVSALRQAHLGEIAAGEFAAMVAGASERAQRMADSSRAGVRAVEAFGMAVEAADDALARAASPAEAAAAIEALRRSTAQVLVAARRMAAEMADARLEADAVRDRLASAEAAARTDPLTGVLNRRGGEADCAAMIASGVAPLSVALIDLDGFSRVNAQWGQAIGDEVLRCVAAHLAAEARRATGSSATLAARFAGDAFLVLLPGLGRRAAMIALDEARAALARQVLRRADDGAALGRISFSAGVAEARPGEAACGLIDRADSAVYAAKRAGRDRVLPAG